jgi:hypothetical protein
MSLFQVGLVLLGIQYPPCTPLYNSRLSSIVMFLSGVYKCIVLISSFGKPFYSIEDMDM